MSVQFSKVLSACKIGFRNWTHHVHSSLKVKQEVEFFSITDPHVVAHLYDFLHRTQLGHPA